ncbi:hypothetical protein MMC12_002034 [Toensbergia leucococca]|nr:hypothetical protein [Toensbergia leucococca]
MGGYTDNVGIETKSLILYLFAEDSDFDKILNIKLRCPACDSQQCPAKIGNNSPCSNNPNVSENPEPIIDPTDLSTIPQSGYQQFNPNGNEEQVCNVACKSDNDCMCSDYQCIMDTTVIGRLRKVTKECVFVVLAAGAASIVNGGKGARDIGRVELLEE